MRRHFSHVIGQKVASHFPGSELATCIGTCRTIDSGQACVGRCAVVVLFTWSLQTECIVSRNAVNNRKVFMRFGLLSVTDSWLFSLLRFRERKRHTDEGSAACICYNVNRNRNGHVSWTFRNSVQLLTDKYCTTCSLNKTKVSVLANGCGTRGIKHFGIDCFPLRVRLVSSCFIPHLFNLIFSYFKKRSIFFPFKNNVRIMDG